MSIKPILFNTEMVRALLDGRKTVTRRVVKDIPLDSKCSCICDDCVTFRWRSKAKNVDAMFNRAKDVNLPYQTGDILWVRETWAQVNESVGMGIKKKKIIYRADYSDIEAEGWKWRPSIHMPREAARIFLRVTGVRVERLHGMTEDDVRCEGFENPGDFIRLWDSAIKPADREKYGWAVNPFCWVISFERISKDEAMQ